MKHLANIITFARIIGAICLLFTGVSADLKSPFWIIYLLCGITDMIDGFLARKLHADTKLGAMLDSIADLCFVGCCAWMLLPILILDNWMWIWIAIIALIKIINQISALVVHGKFMFPHTIANKVTGVLLFLSISIYACFDLYMPIIITAIFATFAAIQEGRLLLGCRDRRTNSRNCLGWV